MNMLLHALGDGPRVQDLAPGTRFRISGKEYELIKPATSAGAIVRVRVDRKIAAAEGGERTVASSEIFRISSGSYVDEIVARPA